MYKICFFSSNHAYLLVCAGEAFHSVNSELRELPAVELSTLPLILKVLADVSIVFLSLPLLFFYWSACFAAEGQIVTELKLNIRVRIAK